MAHDLAELSFPVVGLILALLSVLLLPVHHLFFPTCQVNLTARAISLIGKSFHHFHHEYEGAAAMEHKAVAYFVNWHVLYIDPLAEIEC